MVPGIVQWPCSRATGARILEVASLAVNAPGVRISQGRPLARRLYRSNLNLYFRKPKEQRLRRDAGPVITELQLGARIRSLRQARHLTLRDVAQRAGVTESFLSQVERDVASPSIATVHRIARALDLSIAQLFANDADTGRVVRKEARRRIVYEGLKAVDEFLTNNNAARLQLILSTIEPGGGTGAEPYTHESDEEVAVVLAGILDLWVGDEHYVLREGDAITYPSRVPHWNSNHGAEPVTVLFCMTPPSF
jgi:transcriptional regulator with XRE-family HTH domain